MHLRALCSWLYMLEHVTVYRAQWCLLRLLEHLQFLRRIVHFLRMTSKREYSSGPRKVEQGCKEAALKWAPCEPSRQRELPWWLAVHLPGFTVDVSSCWPLHGRDTSLMPARACESIRVVVHQATSFPLGHGAIGPLGYSSYLSLNKVAQLSASPLIDSSVNFLFVK